MSIYKIAGVTVEMTPHHPTLTRQSEAYRIDSEKEAQEHVQMKLLLPEEYLKMKQEQNPHLSPDDCEYIWYGFEFYRRLPFFGGIMLHSSCIAVDGEAYLFSAPCGTGKSTHTTLWKKYFGDRAVYVNDDKPALCVRDGKVLACGTPFSGKTDLNTNICVPARGICILERGEKNEIHRISAKEALPRFMNQTFRPFDAAGMEKTLALLDILFSSIPVYELHCDMSEDAVLTSYNGMKNKE